LKDKRLLFLADKGEIIKRKLVSVENGVISYARKMSLAALERKTGSPFVLVLSGIRA